MEYVIAYCKSLDIRHIDIKTAHFNLGLQEYEQTKVQFSNQCLILLLLLSYFIIEKDVILIQK